MKNCLLILFACFPVLLFGQNNCVRPHLTEIENEHYKNDKIVAFDIVVMDGHAIVTTRDTIVLLDIYKSFSVRKIVESSFINLEVMVVGTALVTTAELYTCE